MTPSFKQQLLRYWLAANAAAIQAGAVTTKTFLTLAGASAAGVAVPVLNLQQAAYVFLGSAAYHLIAFLAQNPLPVAAPLANAEQAIPGMTFEELRKYFDAATGTYRIPVEKLSPQPATSTEKPT